MKKAKLLIIEKIAHILIQIFELFVASKTTILHHCVGLTRKTKTRNQKNNKKRGQITLKKTSHIGHEMETLVGDQFFMLKTRPRTLIVQVYAQV